MIPAGHHTTHWCAPDHVTLEPRVAVGPVEGCPGCATTETPDPRERETRSTSG